MSAHTLSSHPTPFTTLNTVLFFCFLYMVFSSTTSSRSLSSPSSIFFYLVTKVLFSPRFFPQLSPSSSSIPLPLPNSLPLSHLTSITPNLSTFHFFNLFLHLTLLLPLLSPLYPLFYATPYIPFFLRSLLLLIHLPPPPPPLHLTINTLPLFNPHYNLPCLVTDTYEIRSTLKGQVKGL